MLLMLEKKQLALQQLCPCLGAEAKVSQEGPETPHLGISLKTTGFSNKYFPCCNILLAYITPPETIGIKYLGSVVY